VNNNRIEAVIFDLDGVITDTARYHYLAWKDLAEDLDIELDEHFNEQLKGIGRMESLELILEKGNRSNNFTLNEKVKLAEKKNELYQVFIQELTPDNILPGILHLIHEIKIENIPIGVASISKNANRILQSLELSHLFDYCADAALIKKSKPDPEIFLKVCEQLKVNPRKSIGIEDAAAGIAAINASNMFATGVGNTLVNTDFKVDKTEQLDWKQIKKAFYDWLAG
jgi:beta-phosphoglucomutase